MEVEIPSEYIQLSTGSGPGLLHGNSGQQYHNGETSTRLLRAAGQ